MVLHKTGTLGPHGLPGSIPGLGVELYLTGIERFLEKIPLFELYM